MCICFSALHFLNIKYICAIYVCMNTCIEYIHQLQYSLPLEKIIYPWGGGGGGVVLYGIMVQVMLVDVSGPTLHFRMRLILSWLFC